MQHDLEPWLRPTEVSNSPVTAPLPASSKIHSWSTQSVNKLSNCQLGRPKWSDHIVRCELSAKPKTIPDHADPRSTRAALLALPRGKFAQMALRRPSHFNPNRCCRTRNHVPNYLISIAPELLRDRHLWAPAAAKRLHLSGKGYRKSAMELPPASVRDDVSRTKNEIDPRSPRSENGSESSRVSVPRRPTLLDQSRQGQTGSLSRTSLPPSGQHARPVS